MEYDKILEIKDNSERTEKLKNYYINDININNWLCNNDIQMIEFNNRIEYKKDNKYHNLDGPAIQYKLDADNSRGIYYINGILMVKDVWENESKQLLRKLKLDML